MRLNKTAIDAMKYSKTNGAKDIRWDDYLPGFGVRIVPSGKKIFVVFYRQKGRQHLMTVGHYGVLTLEEARKKAKRILSDVIEGEDPIVEKKEERDAKTVKDLCEEFIEIHARPHKKTWKEDQRRIDRHVLPRWGTWKISAVTHADIAKFHHERSLVAPYEANRSVEMIRTMFTMAKRWGYLQGENPAAGIRDNREVKRDRYVTGDEMPRLMKVLNEEENLHGRAAIILYILTGMRRSELLQVKWSDIDWARNELRLPDTKAGRTHYIPLSSPAQAILKGLPVVKGNPYVFPGAKDGTHLTEIKKTWERVRKLAGLEDVRLHDLRRTTGSWLAQAGNSLHLVGKVLNHSSPVTTAVYARFAQDNVRDALEGFAEELSGVATKASVAKVIPFTKSVKRKGAKKRHDDEASRGAAQAEAPREPEKENDSKRTAEELRVNYKGMIVH